jgi:hypothetical protein
LAKKSDQAVMILRGETVQYPPSRAADLATFGPHAIVSRDNLFGNRHRIPTFPISLTLFWPAS